VLDEPQVQPEEILMSISSTRCIDKDGNKTDVLIEKGKKDRNIFSTHIEPCARLLIQKNAEDVRDAV
jgi:hypothetical protein